MNNRHWPIWAAPRGPERQPLAPIPPPPPAQQIHVPQPMPPLADAERTLEAPGVTADLA
jgi:hypothetical protein